MRSLAFAVLLAPGLVSAADWRIAGTTAVVVSPHAESACNAKPPEALRLCRVDAKLEAIAERLGRRLKIRARGVTSWRKRMGIRVMSERRAQRSRGVVRVTFTADVAGARAPIKLDAKGRGTLELKVHRQPDLLSANALRRFKATRRANAAWVETLTLDAMPPPAGPRVQAPAKAPAPAPEGPAAP